MLFMCMRGNFEFVEPTSVIGLVETAESMLNVDVRVDVDVGVSVYVGVEVVLVVAAGFRVGVSVVALRRVVSCSSVGCFTGAVHCGASERGGNGKGRGGEAM